MKQLIGMMILAAMVAGCATPTVINRTNPADVAMSCSDIQAAIAEAERFEQAAREDRGVTALNVGAALFFWPALVGTYVNTEEAINAAEDRQRLMGQLYDERGCNNHATS